MLATCLSLGADPYTVKQCSAETRRGETIKEMIISDDDCTDRRQWSSDGKRYDQLRR
jgi:hypothetical protein